jgi:hypothetical protein
VVDRRHRPGGHWLDAYPFVRLHQPSANYGVTSRRLGENRIDESGVNAGWYERATADEICDYFSRVLEDAVASGRVLFLGMSDYGGHDVDGHHVTSLLTGGETLIRARKFVDATYVASEIPSRHTPSYAIDPGVHFIPPNDLVHLNEPAARFTVIGGGKTAMDTCSWLLDNGVEPDAIQWIKSRDAWLFDRASIQPLQLVGTFMQMQSRWVEAAAMAEDGADFARRLEAQDVFLRVDPGVEPELFRGTTISTREVEGLRSIEHVTRLGRVRHIGARRVALDQGEVSSGPDEVYIDCTAAGLPSTITRPVFEPGRITVQFVTIGFMPWSAATIGTVEAFRDDDAEKNRLCPPLTFTGNISDVLNLAYIGMTGLLGRSAEPDLATWTEGCRLNPASGAMERIGEAQVATALALLGSNIEPALRNLADRAGTGLPT